MKPLDSKRGRTAFKEKQAAGLHAMGICMTYRMHPFLKVAAAVKPPLASNGITTCFAHPSPGTWQNRVGPNSQSSNAVGIRYTMILLRKFDNPRVIGPCVSHIHEDRPHFLYSRQYTYPSLELDRRCTTSQRLSATHYEPQTRRSPVN